MMIEADFMPIRQSDGGSFIVEDSQGYNFQFDTIESATRYRDACLTFIYGLAVTELVQRTGYPARRVWRKGTLDD